MGSLRSILTADDGVERPLLRGIVCQVRGISPHEQKGPFHEED
jgi:hypothetical protein